MSFIDPPRRIPLLLRIALFFVERHMGRKLLANRILAWYPKAAFGSGIMEGLVAHGEPEVPRRLLALIRIFTSFTVSCPFCIDMNSKDFHGKGVSDEEILALKGALPLDHVPTLSPKERAALRYVECMCRTPLAFSPEVIWGNARALHRAGDGDRCQHGRPGQLLGPAYPVPRRPTRRLFHGLSDP